MKTNHIAAFLLVSALVAGGATYGIIAWKSSKSASPELGEKLLLAEKFVAQGDSAKALEVLDGLAAKGLKPGEAGDLLRLRILEADGNTVAAAKSAAAFVAAYPTSKDRLLAERIVLENDLASGKPGPAAIAKAEAFLKANPAVPGIEKLSAALAQADLAAGRNDSALARVDASSDAAFAVQAKIGNQNLEHFFSAEAQEGDATYTIAKGDTINRVAKKNGITEELLLRVNGINDPRGLRIGQKLRVPSVDFSLHVDITANTMTLKNHGGFFKIYKVRTGREAGTTPIGEFKLLNKKRAPVWRPGNGYVYAAGDPNNELGTRWMSFEGDILGIHGTLHPETVGEYASNGCVGMLKEDVEELFDLITVGTSLTITGEQDLTRHKVIPAATLVPPKEVASR